jgi:hypothetical protein
VLNIMVSVSQWEREAIGERTREAMHHKRAQGERVGTVPFGCRTAADGAHLEADPREQGVLSRILELRATGHTTRQIADKLNQRGFTTRRGTAWRFQYVAGGSGRHQPARWGLARMFHQQSATARDRAASTALRLVAVLDVLSSTPPVGYGRAPRGIV